MLESNEDKINDKKTTKKKDKAAEKINVKVDESEQITEDNNSQELEI